MRRSPVQARRALGLVLALVVAAVVVPAVALPVVPAAAQQAVVSSASLFSESGDFIGEGRDHHAFPGGGAITASSASSLGYVGFGVRAGDTGETFSLEFHPPAADPTLRPQHYAGAWRLRSGDQTRPGMSISGGSRGCSSLTGHFTVLDIVGSDRGLERLHLVFEQHCEGSARSLFGEIRYRMPVADGPVLVPAVVPWPVQFRGAEARPVSTLVVNPTAQPVALGTPRLAGASAGSFRLLGSGCSSALPAAGSCPVTVGFTPTASGPVTASLEVPTGGGTRSASLRGSAHPGTTSWQLRGEPGDVVTRGITRDFQPPSTTRFNAWGDEWGIEVEARDDRGDWWQVHLDPPAAGPPLEVGKTYQVDHAKSGYPSSPTLLLIGPGRSCDGGRFTIDELTWSRDELLTLRATFEHRCGSAPGSAFGSISYRVSPPSPSLLVDLVSVTGTDGQLWVRRSDRSSWTPLGGRLVDAPVAVRTRGRLVFVGLGEDRNVWVRTLDDGWQRFGPPGTWCDGPSAVASTYLLSVACRGQDGGLWYAHVDTALPGLPRVRGWSSLGGVALHGPAVVDATETGAHPRFRWSVVGRDGRPWSRGEGPDQPWVPTDGQRCGGVLAASETGTQLACRDAASTGLRVFGSGGSAVVPARFTGRAGVAADPLSSRFYVLGADGGVWVAERGRDGAVRGFAPFGGAGVGGISVVGVARTP
ncbi:MAG TPA: hypothetical protein VM433_08845 [Mycobacteriales bacterium]|nr:hypothetical protein [Mycobacteriales bacterium]